MALILFCLDFWWNLRYESFLLNKCRSHINIKPRFCMCPSYQRSKCPIRSAMSAFVLPGRLLSSLGRSTSHVEPLPTHPSVSMRQGGVKLQTQGKIWRRRCRCDRDAKANEMLNVDWMSFIFISCGEKVPTKEMRAHSHSIAPPISPLSYARLCVQERAIFVTLQWQPLK